MKSDYYFTLCDFYYHITFNPLLDNNYKARIIEIAKSSKINFLFQKPKNIDCVLYFDIPNSQKIINMRLSDFFIFLLNKKNSIYKIFFIDNTKTFYLILRITLFYLLAKSGGFMVHASAVAKYNNAFIFSGNPGVGKTTISNIFNKGFKKISDDIIVIRKIEEFYYAYSLMFMEQMEVNSIKMNRFKIKKFFFIERSSNNLNKIRQIKRIEIGNLLRQVLLLNDNQTNKKIINNWLIFIRLNKIYKLEFTLNKRKNLMKLIKRKSL